MTVSLKKPLRLFLRKSHGGGVCHIPAINLLIEFDGIQHRQPVTFFGGVEGFKTRVKLDVIKSTYAQNNHIGLIRIESLKHVDNILSPWIDMYNSSETINYGYYNNKVFIDDLCI
jgi:hypothetical protein